MVSSIGLNRGRGQLKNFLGALMILNSKSVFLAVNAILRWLNNVSGVYLFQFPCVLLVSRVGTFLRCRPLLPID
jgi:hypothetical protein